MKSLKLINKKKQEEISAVESVSDAPQYPWGTRLNLEEEQVAKFAELKGVAVGQELRATIKVRVKRVEESASEGEGGQKHTRQSVELQVTDMEFVSAKVPADASKLYGGEKQ
jgi:hypothetical protein